MHRILGEIFVGLDLNSELGIADHHRRGFYRLRVALLLVGVGLASLLLTALCSSTQTMFASRPLIRAVVAIIQTGANALAVVGLCTGATAFICGIYEVTTRSAWCALSKTVRWLILLVGIPLVLAGPLVMTSTLVDRWR